MEQTPETIEQTPDATDQTSWQGPERRRSKRWNLIIPLRLLEVGSEICVGRVVDISLHGMRVVSDCALDEEDSMHFDLEMPDDQDQWTKMRVHAAAVHSRRDAESGEFTTGFEFLEYEPNLMKLQRLIDNRSWFT